MPTYDQDAFLPGAVASLRAQTLTEWELLVVDDGSPGDTLAALGSAAEDPRVRLARVPVNGGLGAALNRGLELARAAYVAYLPSDDRYHADHLASLAATLDARPGAVLASAGLRHGSFGELASGRVEGEPLQLVQVMHRGTGRRWVERDELTTDDLDLMFWARLREDGEAVATGRVTCQWTSHPRQRHRVLREPDGGLNPYRARYGVRTPLRFKSTVGDLYDEVERYRELRERPDTPPARDGLSILLVGELSHNPSRILALEERGHTLHGLWTGEPQWYSSIGPLPFGHVRDVPRDGWREAVQRLRPDAIYALLNWPAVRLAHEVLEARLGIPFVWHLKEGPFDCRIRDRWSDLVDLHVHSDAQVYSTAEMRDWFHATVPATREGLSHVLDGDLPRRRPDAEERQPLLSERDGQVHTVIPGRPIGPDPATVGRLAEHGVHVHVYSEKVHVQWRAWLDEAQRLAAGHLHLHPQVDEQDWVRELSRYDAGWLHSFASENGGDLHAATWNDLNCPARMSTLAAAGLPMIQRDNRGATVATQTLARRHDLGVFYRDADDLAAQLRDRARMRQLRDSVWAHRHRFTFDAHADGLVAFLREAIARSAQRPRPGGARRRRSRMSGARSR